jgi:hypothetical protein
MPVTPEPLPELEPAPVPAASKRRNQILAIGAIVIAAAVPILMAFGVDVCSTTRAVGIELAACKPAPAPAPSPGAQGDAGVK